MSETPLASCMGCAFFLDNKDPNNRIAKNIGAPMCAAKVMPLTLPGVSEGEAIKSLTAAASGCIVGMSKGDPAARTKLATFIGKLSRTSMPLFIGQGNKVPDLQPADVRSCVGCEAFMQPRAVAEKFGWGRAGVCTARALLVPINRAVDVAQECDVPNKQVDTGAPKPLTNITLFSHFNLADDAFSDGGTAIDIFLEPTVIIDPSSYETDAPVSKEQEESGIRAWRKIVNPDDETLHVMLPIFRRDFFSEEEQAKIPKTGDDEHPELYLDYSRTLYPALVFWLKLDETPVLWGPPGVGKTEFFRHLAWMMNLPFERISITASSDLDELAGKMLFEEGETRFNMGRVPKAWSKPCIVVLDEPNTGPPEVWQFLRPLTDNSKQMVLDGNKGERILRHDFCFLGMAMNPAWDFKNTGTEVIADADSSRLMHLYIGMPDESTEMTILRDRIKTDGWVVSDRVLKAVMKIAGDVRAMSDQGTLSITWGIRHQIKALRALRWMTPLAAYKAAAANFLEPEEGELILESVRRTLTSVDR